MILDIYSKNADFQRFVVLKTNRVKRYRHRAFFVEGVRNINEAVGGGWRVESFLFSRGAELSGWANNLLASVETVANYRLSPELMGELSGKEHPSELLAIAAMREQDAERVPLSDPPLLALFDRPSNHGNLGSVIRSCDALGVDGLLMTGHAVDAYDPEVLAASMGSFFRLPLARIEDHSALRAWLGSLRARWPGFQAVGTTAHGERAIDEVDFTRPTLILLGSEADGLSRALREHCDLLATLPMSAASSASSLNVACAATAIFYEAARQRRHAGIHLEERIKELEP